jgi:predicted small lipoprotein YifL
MTFFSAAAFLVSLTGCGSKEGSTLIQPTTDYQLTEQEEINRAAVKAARAGDQ